jgi:hypothetical protein
MACREQQNSHVSHSEKLSADSVKPWEFRRKLSQKKRTFTVPTSVQSNWAKLSVGIEVANQLAEALKIKLSNLVRLAE